MGRIVTLVCVLLPFLVFSQNRKETGKPFIKNYSIEDYGAHAQNWDVLQDKRGIMYFGNSLGCLEYDGTSWRLIQAANRSIVRNLAMDEEGTVYVGGDGEFGYLGQDSLGQTQIVSLVDQIPEELRLFPGVNVHVNNQGTYYGTSPSVFLWNGEKMSVPQVRRVRRQNLIS